MSEKNRLAGEILDHLRFYQRLGVRWLHIGQAHRQLNAPPHQLAVEAVRSAWSPKTSPAGASPVARSFSQHVSMFDALPTAQESLATVREDLGDCRRCKLAPLRKNLVFGSGNPHAELMFVGEAPGAEEDEQGLPFVGRAGQLLTKVIEAIQMRRADVYICNILKCRPPGNRNPESDEIAACEPFLLRQIAAIKPKVICALGTFGAQTLLRSKEPISRLRGQFIDYRGSKLIATFHPAYLLRNPNEKRRVWEDVQKIRDYLLSLRATK